MVERPGRIPNSSSTASGGGILLALLRVGHLVGELRAILLFFALFELILDLIPVVHQDHV